MQYKICYHLVILNFFSLSYKAQNFFQQKNPRVAIENPHRDKDQAYLHTKLNELLIDFHIDNLPHTIRGPQR